MTLFGIKCPYCDRFQIAIKRQLGLMVVCSQCSREFVCAEGEELNFVKNREDVVDVVFFEKQISKALFSYGIAVPSSMFEMVKSRLSETLSFGESMKAKLLFYGKEFPIEVKWFVNHRGVVCLHFIWQKSSGIMECLAKAYKNEYRYYMIENGNEKKKGWKVKISLTNREDVFCLDEDRFSNVSSKREAKGARVNGTRRGVDVLSLDEILR